MFCPFITKLNFSRQKYSARNKNLDFGAKIQIYHTCYSFEMSIFSAKFQIIALPIFLSKLNFCSKIGLLPQCDNLPRLETISENDTLCFFLILVIKGDANWNLTIAIFFRLRRQMASLPISSLKTTCSNLRINLGGIALSLSPKYCCNAYSKEFVSFCSTLQIASVRKGWKLVLENSPGGEDSIFHSLTEFGSKYDFLRYLKVKICFYARSNILLPFVFSAKIQISDLVFIKS